MRVVEVGQYFVTKDTGSSRQFRSVACREYTHPRSDESSQTNRCIQGNTRIGPVLEFPTSYLYWKHGIEIRIWSLRKDNSQSWVRISHGSKKFVIDSNYNSTEVPEDLPEEQASQSIFKVFYSQIKCENINLQRAKVYRLFRFCVLSWRVHQHPKSTKLGRTEILAESVESPLNSSGTSSQDWIRCSSEIFRRRILVMSMLNDILVERKTMKESAWQMLNWSPYLQRSLVLDSGHLLVQVPKRKWSSMEEK